MGLAVVLALAAVVLLKAFQATPPGPVRPPVTTPRAVVASPSSPVLIPARFVQLSGSLVAVDGALLVLDDLAEKVTLVGGGESRPAWTTAVAGRPVGAAAAEPSSVWVATRNDEAGGPGAFRLIRLSRRSGQVLSSIALPDVPFSLAATSHTLWVGSDNALLRVDPVTGRVRRLAVAGGGVTDLLADPFSEQLYGLITGESRGRVMAWSGSDGRVIARHLEPGTADTNGMFPSSMALGFGALWVTTDTPDLAHGALERLDLRTLQLREPGAQGVTAQSAIASGPDALWLTGSDHSGKPILTCFKPTTPDYALGKQYQLTDDFSPDRLPAQSLAVLGSHIYVRGGHRIQEVDVDSVC
jgi:hypothetical protein